MQVIQRLVDPLIEHTPGLNIVGECVLHLDEQVACTGTGKGHQLELPKELLPLLHTGSLFGDWDTI